MADSSYYQGDYIRHPVLYELSHKYGLQTDENEAALPCRLEELKEHIRREIRKELKLKAGAEKLREVATDRRSLADVALLVKKSNSRLSELHAELHELDSQILLNNGQDAALSPQHGRANSSNGDGLIHDLRLLSLEKQLNIEQKVKQGAENMIASLTASHSRDKKLLAEAHQMLADSRAKIEFLKMRILKVKQLRHSNVDPSSVPNNTSSNGSGELNQTKDKFETPLEERVEELRHRLRIEAAVVEGAKNVIKMLQSSKVVDKRALQESTPKVMQEWSVHAEVTFSHGTQTPAAQHPGSNVSMDYSWQKPTTTSSTTTNLRPCYGFQRGNILFTTTPPRSSQHDVRQSSGAPQPAKPAQHPYDRRCKSTCSIVLANPGEPTQSFHYHCGDRACYHARPPYTSGFSTIPENCEVCNSNQTSDCHSGKSNTFTTHFCTRVPERSVNKERQDAASQTDTGHNVAAENLQVPDVPLQKKKLSKRLSRSPARLSGKSPLLQRRYSEVSQATSSRSSTPDVDCNQQLCQGKPRTVHIDVYCTGSEDADASASSEADTTDESSPQTVFESEQLHVMHTKMGKCSLPKGLKQVPRRSESLKEKSNVNNYLEPKGYESDDVLSSQYPSRLSSYTSLKDSASGLLSERSSTVRDPSWSTISSCAISCDNKDSVASSSWKDVSTELDSAAVSSSSFVNKFDPYLTQSDSFEYADMTDRIRIKEKAMAWADRNSDQQPDIENKHLHQQQKFKEFLYRHLGKGTFPLWKSQHSDDSEEDEDDDDDDTGDAWSFIGRGCSGTSLRRENTVKKVAKSTTPSEEANIKSLTLPLRVNHLMCDTGSLSDSGPPSVNRFARRIAIGPFGSKPPSPPPLKVESSVVSPFTVQGAGTDQLSKAQKFGAIVGTLKKPGNHTGPSKNPYCSCAHCRSFYEATLHSGRARSVCDLNFYPEAGQPSECRAQNMQDTKLKCPETEDVKSSTITDSSESDGTPV